MSKAGEQHMPRLEEERDAQRQEASEVRDQLRQSQMKMWPLMGNQLGIATLAFAMKSEVNKLEADIALMEREKKSLEQKLTI
jgi:hypothetical protein